MKKYINQPDEIDDGETIRRAFSNSVVKSIDSDKRQIEFIISTASVDRMGDIIEVGGWDLKTYKTNPVVLFGHMSSIPPIGKAIKTWKDGDALRSVAEFMPQDISAFAHSIFRMYEEGYLRAVSVGFRPLKWERIVDENGDETWCYRFKKQELLEFSAVPIPANPDALIAARQKGIDTSPIKSWAEEMLDKWNETENSLKSLYGVERKEMETIRRRAAGAGSTFRVPPDVQDEIMKKNLEAIRAHKAAKAKKFKTFEHGDIEFELPVMQADQYKDSGTVEISHEEINNKKTLTLEKADDSALFSLEILGEDEIASVEIREVDGDNDLILTLKGDNMTVEYDLIGYTAEGTLYGVKTNETKADEGEDEEKGKKPEDDEDKSSDDDAEDEEDSDDAKASNDDESDDDDDSDDEGEDEKSKDDDDEDEDEKASKTDVTKDLDDDDDIELDFEGQLRLLEGILVQFEDALDENDQKSFTRHQERKVRFLASCMRELADRLDGGKKGEDGKKSSNKTSTKGVADEDETLTAEQATDYVKNMTEKLQPLLAEMIASKISKAKGRLD